MSNSSKNSNSSTPHTDQGSDGELRDLLIEAQFGIRPGDTVNEQPLVDTPAVAYEIDEYFKTEKTQRLMQLILADHATHVREARKEGARQYNRILTDELGKAEYTAIGLDGIVGVYRQTLVGEAIRKANSICIAELTPKPGEEEES